MITCGIDQSLTSTAVVILDGDQILHYQLIKTDIDDGDAVDRAIKISDLILTVISQHKPQIINIEEPVVVRSANGAIKLSILFGVIVSRLRLLKPVGLINGYRPTINSINPKTLKLQASGKGNASKDEMQAQVPTTILEQWQHIKKVDDLVDAYHLARLQLH